MTDINFQPIFDYLDNSIWGLKTSLKKEIMTEVRAELSDIKTAIANLSGQVQGYHNEMLVSGHRVDRLEKWAKQVGKKVDLPIEF